MYFVRFSSMRVVEHADPSAFEHRAGKWLGLREGENCYLLGKLPSLIARTRQTPGTPGPERFFTVEDGEQLMGAAILFGGGCLWMSWATDEIIEALAQHLAGAQCPITSILAPEHASWKFAQEWTRLTHQTFQIQRSERIYQLSMCTYMPPAGGSLEPATEQDLGFLLPWMEGMVAETHFEAEVPPDRLLALLVAERRLYLWKNPQPVAMAAWVSPTPHGGSINLVYTPPELRGKGHAKAVVSALAMGMLAHGRKYCFILTDPEDQRTNRLYQSVGARTLCELLRCTIAPAGAATRVAGAQNRHAVRS